MRPLFRHAARSASPCKFRACQSPSEPAATSASGRSCGCTQVFRLCKKEGLLGLLYGTFSGRVLLRILISAPVTGLAGLLLRSPISRLLIDPFIRKNQVSLKGMQIPAGGYASFDEFFCRKKIKTVFDRDPVSCISPCDGLLSVASLERGCLLEVKHAAVTLSELLGDEDLAEDFEGGTALIYRLTPRHYHRYIYTCAGEIVEDCTIPGLFHTVRPIAVRTVPVYGINQRQYQVISYAESKRLIQMEVGAMLVGSICNADRGPVVKRGMEKGCFRFGGSTIIMLYQKGAMALDEGLREACAGREIPVTQGQRVGSWLTP